MDVSQGMDYGCFMTNLFGDHYLHSVNHSAFNEVGSRELFRNYYGDRFKSKNSLFIIVGTDSGLLLKFLLEEEPLASGSKVLFVEFPGLIDRLAQVMDFSLLPKSIRVVSADNWLEQLKKWNFASYVYLESLQLLESIGAADGNIPEYKELFGSLRQQLDGDVWQVKAGIGSAFFLVRQLENLAENRHPVTCLKNSFAGKTCVVLGGGPSLDDVLPWLLEHRDEVAILAVSRISRRLQDVGLIPHLVFSTDPFDVSYEVSKEMLKFDSSIVFVQSYHACSKLVGQWHGQSLYLGDRLPWKSDLNSENSYQRGPTVTNSALSVAILMGFEQILLSGFDLCFTEEGISHAKGSNEHAAGPRLGQLLPTVETNAGHIVTTSQAYFAAMVDLSAQAEGATKKGCRIINLAAGAAKIDFVEYQPLEQISLLPCAVSPEKVLKNLVPSDCLEDRRNDIKRLVDELNRTRVSLHKIENLAREALDCNDGLFGRNGKVADFKYKKRMDKIERKLNRDYSDLVTLCKEYGLRLFLKTTRPDSDAEWTDAEIEETGRIYYETYLLSTSELRKLLEDALERLYLRLEELAEKPDIDRLIAYWEKEKLTGRAQILLDQERAECAPEQRDRLERLTDDFRSEISHVKNWEKESNLDPAGVKSKAQLLFREKSLQALEQLKQTIDKYYGELEVAQQLGCLLEGYCAELKNQSEQALDAYQRLITEDVHALSEEALTRIASMSLDLQDSENALLALECLAQISPAYQPNYAAMLKLAGNYAAAAEVYGDYLGKAPEDATAMLKLGQLYREMGVVDAARTAFKYVLEMDPENSAAQTLLEELGGDNA